MAQTTGINDRFHGQRLRKTYLQRNFKTAAIVGLAFSGGIFGVTWLALTCGFTFAGLIAQRLYKEGKNKPVSNE